MNQDTEIDNNYRKSIEKAVIIGAPEKSLLVLKYLYLRIIDGEILTHESVINQVLQDSRDLVNMADFSEENVCRVMYGGDRERMDRDYEYAIQIRETLDDLI